MNDIRIIKYVLGYNRTHGKLIPLQPIKKTKQKNNSFFNCKINVRTSFLDPENTGKGTKTDFLSQILRKLWGFLFCIHYMTEKLLKGAGVAHSDSRLYDMSSK